MRPLVIGGHVWGVVGVSPGDPFLVDRTGTPRLATADATTRTIRMSDAIPAHMRDRVLLHEAAHAAMHEAGVTDLLAGEPDDSRRILAEELLAWFLETHAVEVVDAVSSHLGRGVCVNGICAEGATWR